MDKFDPAENDYVICSDHFQSGYLAAKHFIDHGRKRLAVVGMESAPMRERVRGFLAAMKEAGVAPDLRLLQLFEPGTSNKYYASNITQKIRSGADAVFAPGASYEGINCLHVLSYVMGLQIPRDVALIAGETPGVSEVMNPPLTTIEEPLQQMAEQAADMIGRLATGEKVEQKRVMLPVRLVERASVF
jgi:LacI family transcriptional regulator